MISATVACFEGLVVETRYCYRYAVPQSRKTTDIPERSRNPSCETYDLEVKIAKGGRTANLLDDLALL